MRKVLFKARFLKLLRKIVILLVVRKKLSEVKAIIWGNNLLMHKHYRIRMTCNIF